MTESFKYFPAKRLKRYGYFRINREITTKETLIKLLMYMPDDLTFISFDRDVMTDSTIIVVSSEHFGVVQDGDIIPEIKLVHLENGDVKWRFDYVEKVLGALKGK